jgi:hypothetical protein
MQETMLQMTTDIRYDAMTKEFHVVSDYLLYERDWNMGHIISTPCVDILTEGNDTKVLSGIWKAKGTLPEMILFRDVPDEQTMETFVRKAGYTLFSRVDGTYVLERRPNITILTPRPRRRIAI